MNTIRLSIIPDFRSINVNNKAEFRISEMKHSALSSYISNMNNFFKDYFGAVVVTVVLWLVCTEMIWKQALDADPTSGGSFFGDHNWTRTAVVCLGVPFLWAVFGYFVRSYPKNKNS